MDKEITKTIIIVSGNIITALVLGEMFGGVISRPIAAWRQSKNNINIDNVATLIDIMNQRICDLEEKVFGASK